MKIEKKIKPVPHIEDIQGCYKYGGIWDKDHKVCIEKVDNLPNIYYQGCTAPVKGIKYCWRRIADVIDVDDVLADTNDTVYKEVYRDGMPAEFDSIMDNVKGNAGAILQVYKTNKYIVCCNPFGKIVDCNRKDAIITHRGMNVADIADSYRKKHGHKTLVDFYKDWRKTPPRVYEKGPKRHSAITQTEFDEKGELWFKDKRDIYENET